MIQFESEGVQLRKFREQLAKGPLPFRTISGSFRNAKAKGNG
jgi:hypothetical protein